jgi:hypothetical protein
VPANLLTELLLFCREIKLDELVKSPKSLFSSFWRKPESSIFIELQKTWIPFSNGVTTFYETVKLTSKKAKLIARWGRKATGLDIFVDSQLTAYFQFKRQPSCRM